MIVEVKGGKGKPRYRVDERKLRKIELAVSCFLRSAEIKYKELRIDVIEVTDGKIKHIKGVDL